MIFIYLFENDQRYFRQIQSLFNKIETGKISAITSIISPLEVLSAKQLSQDQEKTAAFVKFFQETPNLTVEEVSWDITLKAAELRRRSQHLKTPDSIQLATAIIKNAGIFLTNDLNLQKSTQLPVEIMSLPDFPTK